MRTKTQRTNSQRQVTCATAGRLKAAAALAVCAGLVLAPAAMAQPADWPKLEVALGWDSGPVAAPRDPHPHQMQGPVVVWETVLDLPGAEFLQLQFDKVELAGVIEEGSAAWLRITGLADGAQQFLNAEGVAQWSNLSAFFAGSGVHIELLAHPNTGESRVILKGATVGLAGGWGQRSICDGVDLRQLSNDPRVARHSVGCTMWLFDDTNRMLGTAGHCGATNSHSAHFNVPLSTSGGTPVPPPPEHQYPVQGESAQGQNSGVGVDWMYFAVHRNANTGLTPYQAQGAHFILAPAAPPITNQQIRITGCGTTSSPVSPTWNQAQKTHVGPFVYNTGTTLRYRTDTTGGNSGSPVIHENSGEVVGVHTHAGCETAGVMGNQGTASHHTGWRAALQNPLGLTRSGRGTVTPPLYAIGDMVNNFGTVNMATGNFAKIKAAPPWMQGLAYDPDNDVFYAVNHNSFTNQRQLFAINPATGDSTVLGDISGTSAVINGLGYDPSGQVLYGIAQATGQLFRIDLDATPGLATPIGSAGGGTISGLEYSREHDALFAVDRSTTPARLLRINTSNGQQTVVGSLGGNITQVRGLGATDEGDLYTIHVPTSTATGGVGHLVRVDALTGAGTVIGNSDGIFGTSAGLSAVIPPGPAPALRITFPSGLPYLVAPGQGHQVTVNIIAGTQVLVPGSARVHVRANGSASFVDVPLAHVSGDEFTAMLPGFACGDTPELYFSAQGNGGGTGILPRNAPQSLFTTNVGVIVAEPVLETMFNSAWPAGWSATGLWHVTSACAPAGNVCTPGPYAYYGRTATCNYNLPTGPSSGILSAPQITLPTLPPEGAIVLKFCYALETEESPNADKAELFVNGQTRPAWRIADVRPSPSEPERFWREAEFDLSEFAGQNITLSWRFDTVNSLNNTFRGWHMNNVRVHATVVGCEDTCYANCDGSTTAPVLNVEDFSCFINKFAEAQNLPHQQQLTHYANCDQSTTAPVLNVEDFSCFINRFAAGCP
jgi:hypothetical protein